MAGLVETDDPRHPGLADFRALNDPDRRRQVERSGDYFVVEGIVAIQRLLALPHWQIRGLALLPKVAERLRDQLVPWDVPVVVADRDVLATVVGFDIHRGALASVDRRPIAAASDLVGSAAPEARRRSALFLAVEGVNDHENLGALYRNAAAFGVAGVLLDPTCADPFYRRSVRVSLGNVLGVPTAALGPLPAGLDDLHQAGVTTVALTPTAERTLGELGRDELGPRPVAVLVGAEGPGLRDVTLETATHRAAIAMAPGVDSVNVATAAAIALHHLV